MEPNLNIDLGPDPDGYGYPALITREARAQELASRILRTYIEERYFAGATDEMGVTLTDWETDDGVPKRYSVSAQMWAGEMWSRLALESTLDTVDELESIEHTEDRLDEVLALHQRGRSAVPDEETGMVPPSAVVAGVRALIDDPRIATVAERRDLTQVYVDLDMGSLVRGRGSVVDIEPVPRIPAHRPARATRSKWDDSRRADSSGPSRRL